MGQSSDSFDKLFLSGSFIVAIEFSPVSENMHHFRIAIYYELTPFA
jgi:hypothetical protein